MNNHEEKMIETLKVVLALKSSVNPVGGRVRHDVSDRESAFCASCVTMMEINHYVTLTITISIRGLAVRFRWPWREVEQRPHVVQTTHRISCEL